MLAIHAKCLKHINKGVTFKKELNRFQFFSRILLSFKDQHFFQTNLKLLLPNHSLAISFFENFVATVLKCGV